MNKRDQKKIPFDFILDYLLHANVEVRPLFGMYSIYQGDKILLILRNRPDQPELNGIWVATKKEYHSSLRSEIPSLNAVPTWAGHTNDSDWQLIPAQIEDFETSAIDICNLIVKNDPRIGKIPDRRKKIK